MWGKTIRKNEQESLHIWLLMFPNIDQEDGCIDALINECMHACMKARVDQGLPPRVRGEAEGAQEQGGRMENVSLGGLWGG